MVDSFEWSLDREKHYPWLLLTKCNTTLSISISVTNLCVSSMYAAGYNIYIAGAISCDSSLMKVSLFGLEFMSTISVNPN